MLSFSVVQSSFSLSGPVPTGLATVKSIFLRKERFNATSALKNPSMVNAPVEFIYARRNLFTNDFAL